MKVLLISPEAGNWISPSGLADAVNSMAQSFMRAGHQVLVVAPLYPHRIESPATLVPLHYGEEPLRGEEFQVFHDPTLPEIRYVGQNRYFNREGIYNDPNRIPYSDNHLRFSHLASVALEHALHCGFLPDLIHAHEWGGGLAAAYVKSGRWPSLSSCPVWVTIHNIAFDHHFIESEIERVGLNRQDFGLDGYEFWGKASLLKVAIHYADKVAFTSQGYLDRLLDSDLPGGIRGFLEFHSSKLIAIQNGLDYGIWDPWHFGCQQVLQAKKESRSTLTRRLGLVDDGSMLICAHLDRESGRTGETISTILSNLLQMEQNLVLGVAPNHPAFSYFESMSQQNPTRIGLVAGIESGIEIRDVLAGSDLYFSAGSEEPSASMVLKAMAAAAVPLVSNDCGCAGLLVSAGMSASANALVADSSLPDHMLRLLRQAREIATVSEWQAMVCSAYEFRFTWDATIRSYLANFGDPGL